MEKTMEQTIQDNLIKIEKLSAIYKQVDDYAKEISGMSINELNASIYEHIEENSILNDIILAEEYERLNN